MKYLLIAIFLISCAKKSDNISNTPIKQNQPIQTPVVQGCGDKPLMSLWIEKGGNLKADYTGYSLTDFNFKNLGYCFYYIKFEGTECTGTIEQVTDGLYPEKCDYLNWKYTYTKTTNGFAMCSIKHPESCIYFE